MGVGGGHACVLLLVVNRDNSPEGPYNKTEFTKTTERDGRDGKSEGRGLDLEGLASHEVLWEKIQV